MPFTAPYAASKHAIEAFADALRVELHSSGVQVALIEPGSVATPIWDKSRAEAERVTHPARARARSTGGCPRRWTGRSQDTGRRGVPPEQVAADDRARARRRGGCAPATSSAATRARC